LNFCLVSGGAETGGRVLELVSECCVTQLRATTELKRSYSVLYLLLPCHILQQQCMRLWFFRISKLTVDDALAVFNVLVFILNYYRYFALRHSVSPGA